MTSDIYPMRSFIKFRAKSQLVADLTGQALISYVNRSGESGSQGLVSPDQHPEVEFNAPQESAQPDEPLDDGLLREIIKNVFHPDRHPELYQPCRSEVEASVVEEQITAEIISAYKQIKLSQQSEIVQHLNSLL